MKVFSMIVDKKPSECVGCPLNVGGIQLMHDECGKRVTVQNAVRGWKESKRVPDERCMIHEIGGD